MDAGVGVLEIGGSVAIHGHHLVEVELIIAGAVLGEVGVFDGSDADDFGDLGAFLRAEFGAIFIDDTACDLYGFVEYAGESDGVSFAGMVPKATCRKSTLSKPQVLAVSKSWWKWSPCR